MKYLVGYVENAELKVKEFKSQREMNKFIKSFKKDDGDNWLYFKIENVEGEFKWLN